MMFISPWWRRRAQHRQSKPLARLLRQALAFERLENRCLLSAGACSNLFLTTSIDPGAGDSSSIAIVSESPAAVVSTSDATANRVDPDPSAAPVLSGADDALSPCQDGAPQPAAEQRLPPDADAAAPATTADAGNTSGGDLQSGGNSAASDGQPSTDGDNGSSGAGQQGIAEDNSSQTDSENQQALNDGGNPVGTTDATGGLSQQGINAVAPSDPNGPTAGGTSADGRCSSPDNSGSDSHGGDITSGDAGAQGQFGRTGASGTAAPVGSEPFSPNGDRGRAQARAAGPGSAGDSPDHSTHRGETNSLSGPSTGDAGTTGDLAGLEASNDALWYWVTVDSEPSPGDAATSMPCSGRGDGPMGGHAPRHGTASGSPDFCEAAAPEAPTRPVTSHETRAVVVDHAAKPALTVRVHSTNPEAEAGLPAKLEEHAPHVLVAAASPHQLGRRRTAPVGTGQGPVVPEAHRAVDTGQAGGLALAAAALPAEDTTAAPTAPAGADPAPTTPLHMQAAPAPGAADWSAWGGLAPQFLVAPYFPKRPQPTIMLAIADEPTRNALNVALTDAGFVVFTAATARDALGVLRTPLAPMDAAVVDVNLPDVSGLHLVGRLKELFPWLPVMMFADPADGAALASLREAGVQVLLKSSATSDMLAQVRALVS